jgi:hypothetical protein
MFVNAPSPLEKRPTDLNEAEPVSWKLTPNPVVAGASVRITTRAELPPSVKVVSEVEMLRVGPVVDVVVVMVNSGYGFGCWGVLVDCLN